MKVTPELLEKYTKELCSLEEKLVVEKWLSSSEWELSFPPEDDLPLHKAAIWEAIEERAWVYEPKLKRKRMAMLFRPWPVAACVLLICILAFFLSKKKIDTQSLTAKRISSTEYQTVRTAKGEKRGIKLSDGTEIYLNADSEIRFPAQFTDASRKVFLNGEAYFAVAKDKRRPFIVQTSQTKTQVLGTIFSLKAYSLHAATLVVKEGKVQFGSVSKNQEPLILTANQRGRFNLESGLKKDNVYATRYMGWKDDRLLFDDESMADIAYTLERWYDADINEIPKDMARQHFTGEFEGKSLEYILERMSYVMQFKYTIKNRTVNIY